MQLGGGFGLASGLLLLDLLLQLAFGLFEVPRRLRHLLAHLFQLLGQLLALSFIELAVLEFLLELAELLQGLLHVALLHRLAELVRRSLLDVLQLLELLSQALRGR